MASSNIGQLDGFDESVEEFYMYIERLDQYFAANEIVDSRKVPVFLTLLGPKTYKLLRNLLRPKLPKEETFQVLVKTLGDYYKPAPIIIAERYRFHRRNQQQNESIAQYVVELQSLAATCEFGQFLEEAIRDRFVCGMKCDATQKRLLAKRDLHLQNAIEIASAMESAEQNNADLKQAVTFANQVSAHEQSSNVANINKVAASHRVWRDAPNAPPKCYRCGRKHDPNECRCKNATCYKCHKIGHIAPMCKDSARSNRSVKLLEKKEESSSSESLNLGHMYVVNDGVNRKKDYIITVGIWKNKLDMILDTAADVSTINKCWIDVHIPFVKIRQTNVALLDYNKSGVQLLGEINVPITYRRQKKILSMYVVGGDRPSLFGKDFIKEFNIDWNNILNVCALYKKNIGDVFTKFSDVFSSNGKPISHFKASIRLTEGSVPVFKKNRNVPYALKGAVEDEIKKICKSGVWKFVQHSKWATPIVIVPKKDGKIRICGDFKITVNQSLDINQYPLPTQQDLFTALNGGRYFTKLDLSSAYQQVELDNKSQEILTLNTHLGLVRPARLLYGIANASAVFQYIMDQILQGLKHVICFQDDILIIGDTREEHDVNLDATLNRLLQYNVKLNKEKCAFAQTKIEYLGHIIDEQGIHPTEEKILAIKEIACPKSITQLRSFLGILNYYIKFIRGASTLLAPLHNLLRKDVKWEWTPECESTFQRCKQVLTSKAVLVHYDPNKKLKLACDASPFGVGAILSHTMSDGEERPIAFASRTLTAAEANYPQIEREALSIVFGLRKFEQYLFGRDFVIVTDHKPLMAIFGPKTSVPALAAARLQRWALLLSTFRYDIEYKKGIHHTNVDALSRCPIEQQEDTPAEVFKVSFIEDLPIFSKDISCATRTDPILGRVCNYVKYGWAYPLPDGMEPFFARKDQLSLENGCVLWGMRVVVPIKFRSYILDLLHDTHPGITRMKSLARSHVWWPGLDRDIEQLSKKCISCIQQSKMPPAAPMQSWVWPKGPWQRVHIDFAQKGPNYFLVVIDSFSKWIEVERMSSTTTQQTIEVLRRMFSRYGLPLEVVSDNGPQLRSDEFRSFLELNGVKHTLIPAYHPQSNGAAERSVQHFKSALAKMNYDKGDQSSLEHKISRFLFMQHVTQHATTGSIPCDLFMGRQLRTKLSFVHMDIGKEVEAKQNVQKHNYDRQHSIQRTICVGDPIWMRQYKLNGDKWKGGTVKERVGSNTWNVDVDGVLKLVHSDQIKKDRPTDLDKQSLSDSVSDSYACDENKTSKIPDIVQLEPNKEMDYETMNTNEGVTVEPSSDAMQDNSNISDDRNLHISERRYPIRNKRKPEKLNL